MNDEVWTIACCPINDNATHAKTIIVLFIMWEMKVTRSKPIMTMFLQ
jgi:hypothetical protein